MALISALGRAVEHRRRERHALLEVLRELEHLLVGQLGDLLSLPL
jgi:hypothetical protein